MAKASTTATASSSGQATAEQQAKPERSGKGAAARKTKTKTGRRAKTSAACEGARTTLYDAVTQRIVGELEAGRLPWVQPWGCAGAAEAGLPRNARTNRPYSGVNILILWGAVIAQGYASQGWLTYAQAQQAGGRVRKGERGTCVVYADRFTPEDEAERAAKGGYAPRSVLFLKRFTIFNVAQCEGLSGLAVDPMPLPEREIVPVGERLIAASGVDIRIGGTRAFYAPGPDFVAVPPQPAFFAQIDYYRTAFHELTHATGHATRLARDQSGAFGSKAYAFEELIAEMGSAFLCAALGIVPTVRHADYLASWLAVLRADNRAIFRAASAASKAADWLLARHAQMEPDRAVSAEPRAAAAAGDAA